VIQQQQIRTMDLDSPQRVLTAGCPVHGEPYLFQQTRGAAQDVGVVVHDEDANEVVQGCST